MFSTTAARSIARNAESLCRKASNTLQNVYKNPWVVLSLAVPRCISRVRAQKCSRPLIARHFIRGGFFFSRRGNFVESGSPPQANILGWFWGNPIVEIYGEHLSISDTCGSRNASGENIRGKLCDSSKMHRKKEPGPRIEQYFPRIRVENVLAPCYRTELLRARPFF